MFVKIGEPANAGICLAEAIKRYAVATGHTVECNILDKDKHIIQTIGAEDSDAQKSEK
jgi:hypothetical protein